MDEGIFIDDLTDDSLISFSGTSDDNVAVYYDNEFIDDAEVYTDVENENREYICINNTIYYL
jgi:hypothetical protein